MASLVEGGPFGQVRLLKGGGCPRASRAFLTPSLP
jgi:hypothetical protein